MKIFFTTGLILISLFSIAQTYNSPESVEYDALHQRYIVANTSGSNLQAVIPGSAPALFISNVPNPYGIAIVGDTIYVCCNSTHLRGYNLSTGTLAFDVNLGGTFLNGICTDFAGNIFVTDFSAKKIFRFNIANQQYNYFVATAMVYSPNGIVYDPFHHRLAIAAWGVNAPILGLSLSDSSISTLKATTLTNIDGLTIDEDGNFYAADWGSDGIYFFDSGFVNAPLKVVSGLSNPADISYNMLSDTLAVPNTGTPNSVKFFGFPRPKPNNDFATVPVSSSQAICVLLNDLISGNIPLRLQSYSAPHLGTATTVGYCIAYTANSVGRDTIEYIVCSVDTPSFCRTGLLITTNINGSGNNAPIAENDTASTIQPNAITVNVAANDFDPDGDTLCISIISLSNHFSTDSTNCGNIIYTPDSSFVGNDTCIYVVCDNGSPILCDTASLIVIVNSCLPNFTLTYSCPNGLQSGTGCYFCGHVVAVGNNVDSISWRVVDESHIFIDTTFLNDDTLSISMGCSEMPNYDLRIPLGTKYIVCATLQNFCGFITVCDTIQIWWSGIEEISLNNISLFPKPTNNILTIDMQNNNEEITRNYSAIEILNAIGQTQKSIPKKGTGKVISLDVNDLPNGIYLATIISDKQEKRMLGKFTVNR